MLESMAYRSPVAAFIWGARINRADNGFKFYNWVFNDKKIVSRDPGTLSLMRNYRLFIAKRSLSLLQGNSVIWA